MLYNFLLKSQTVAEKTAKNFMGPLFCRTLYVSLGLYVETHPQTFNSRLYVPCMCLYVEVVKFQVCNA